MPLGQALSTVYYLADEWGWRRDVLAALGVEEADVIRRDAILEPPAPARPAARGEARIAEIAGFIEGMGGGEFHGG